MLGEVPHDAPGEAEAVGEAQQVLQRPAGEEPARVLPGSTAWVLDAYAVLNEGGLHVVGGPGEFAYVGSNSTI